MQTESSTIRLAKPGDGVRINQLSQFLGYQALSESSAQNNLDRLLASASDKVWVYQSPGQLDGWIHLLICYRLGSQAFAEIGGIVVDAKQQGEGIGRALVEQAVAWARLERLGLRVRCNAKREKTFKFYRALGFNELKIQQVLELS